jgi:putative solute:sodium symporter small subunit
LFSGEERRQLAGPDTTHVALEGGMANSEQNANKERHWEKTRNLTYLVLAIWAIFAIVVPWFARELDTFTFMGFKLGYYFVVQGSLIIFVLLIWFQNWRQDAIDDEFGE